MRITPAPLFLHKAAALKAVAPQPPSIPICQLQLWGLQSGHSSESELHENSPGCYRQAGTALVNSLQQHQTPQHKRRELLGEGVGAAVLVSPSSASPPIQLLLLEQDLPRSKPPGLPVQSLPARRWGDACGLTHGTGRCKMPS